MSKKITSKRYNNANKVSHANNKESKKQNLNLQWITVGGVRFKTTAREAKTFRKLFNK